MTDDPSKGPTVADLLKMAGAKPAAEKKFVFLTFSACMLLHDIIMCAPEGKEVQVLDASLGPLRDLGYIRQEPNGRWLPTEEGVRHMRPDIARAEDKARRKRQN